MGERYRPSPEVASAKQQELLARLTAGIESVHSSADFQNYLRFMGRFHKYSANNVMLIMLQRPDATMVAGFETWKSMGRWVKKRPDDVPEGKWGISIVRPYKVRGEDSDEAQTLWNIRGFGITHVYDVAQTDGKPLPEVAVPKLEGEQGRELWDDLARVAEVDRLGLIRALPSQMPPGDVMGYYSPTKKEIVVAEYSQKQMTKTLAHELAHHHHLTYEGQEAQDRAERETVAESVAYVVLSHYGIDSGERSFPYVATWAGNQERFRAQLAVIGRLSGRLIEAVELVREVRGVRLPQNPGQSSLGERSILRDTSARFGRAHHGRPSGQAPSAF